MAYIDDDQSIHDGAPAELYKFEGPSASFEYFYTSNGEDVVFGGDTYIAMPIERGAVEGSTHDDPPELLIKLPVSAAVVQAYAFNTPPRSLELTIYRMHLPAGAGVTYWKGEITGVSVQGSIASFRSPSLLEDPMSSPISNVYYQGVCNHVLYDDRCKLAAAAYKSSPTVVSISGDEVVVSTVGAFPDQYYQGGEMVRPSDGDRRLILSQVGTTFILSKAFRDLAATNVVDIYAGCDHTVETCRDKFAANILNYGGYPYIPNANPFLSGWRGVE